MASDSNSAGQYQYQYQQQQAYQYSSAPNGTSNGFQSPQQHPTHQDTSLSPAQQDSIHSLPRYSSPPPPLISSMSYIQQPHQDPMSPGYSTEQSTGIVTPQSHQQLQTQPPQQQQMLIQPPQPAQTTVVQQMYIPQPVGVTDSRASMVWKPVVHTEDEFHYSLCGCIKDFFTCKKMNTCCCGYWCPCILYSRISHRLHSAHPITISDTEFSNCNGICCAFWCLGAVGMTFAQRSEMRHRYKLRGSCCGDCLRAWCCLQCTLCQEEKELILREKQLEQLVNANRYEVTPGMTMSYVAQEKR